MKSIEIDGNTYRFNDRSTSSEVLASELELLAELVDSVAEKDAKSHSLPATLTFDGTVFEVEYWRTWLAVGRGDSRMEVSDLDVLGLISRSGIDGPPQRFSLSTFAASFPEAIDGIRRRLESPRIKDEVARIQNLYKGRRGLMVVDVVSSRQRRYDSMVVNRILPSYQVATKDLGLGWLAQNEPVFLKLRAGEAKTMRELAQFLLSFSSNTDDETTIENFARLSNKPGIRASAIDINGIGPVLYEYLRLLCGVDTIKIDSRVRASLRAVGVPQHLFSDQGLLELCGGLSASLGCSLIELDQALWLELDGHS